MNTKDIKRFGDQILDAIHKANLIKREKKVPKGKDVTKGIAGPETLDNAKTVNGSLQYVQMPKDFKVALVHDFFYVNGGAEKVFFALVDLFYKDSPVDVYTFFVHSKYQLPDKYREKINIIPLVDSSSSFSGRFWQKILDIVYSSSKLSTILKLPAVYKMWYSFSKLDLSDKGYNLIISDTSSFANAVKTGNVPHVSYIHTPFRAIWGLDSSKLKKGVVRNLLDLTIFKFFRLKNLKAVKRVDLLIANSQEVKKRIKRFWGLNAVVVNPPVAVTIDDAKLAKLKSNLSDYYIFVNRLESYKKIDELLKIWPKDKKLKVVGSGSLLKTLKAQYKNNKNIEFLGFVKDITKDKLIARAKALVYPNKEDYGIGMAEAVILKTPVIALNAGGAREIVKHKKTGYLMPKLDQPNLKEAIKWVEERQ